MADEKIILVTGATGAQGGGVVRHLLKGGKFKIRCLTRKPESEKASALVQAGTEIVRGDLGNPESLQAAMKGCYGVFGVTNFWEHFEKEAFHGKNLVDAVKKAGIKHFVFSTLPSVRKHSEGKLEVPHFDLKA
ncbi:MAG TPA: NmrA family NAD(P)-binding protein, partial [Terriglobia bacterium]|nr:NmrA family NAD(P)-binding protein [Terriglobia bacterium]